MRRLVVPTRALGACLAALALVAGTAHAQAEPRRFNVGVHGGAYRFDKATGLEQSAGFAGIDATYQLPTIDLARKIEPGIGFYVTAALPTTDYTQFPLVAFDYGDTTFINGVSQRVQLFEYGLQGTLGTTISKFRLYALGGAGFYTMRLDPRQEKLKTFNEPALQVGGGINWIVSRTLGVRAEVRNSTWTSYDRNRLDPTVSYIRDTRVRDILPPPAAPKTSVQNLRFGLVFSYVPGGSGGGEDAVPQGGTP